MSHAGGHDWGGRTDILPCGVRRVLVAIAAALGLPALAHAQLPSMTQTPAIQTAAGALAQDAAEYARLMHVDMPVAVQRMGAQEASVVATDHIRQLFRSRLAGITIEHQPAYRIVVLLTGDEPVASFDIAAGGLTVPVVFKTGAAATEDQIVGAITDYQAAIRSRLIMPPGMGMDPRTGELVIVVHAADLAQRDASSLQSEFQMLTGVPVRIRPQGLEHRDLIAGGTRLDGPADLQGEHDSCTAGFVVTDGLRTGLVTAAHCPDALTYMEADGGEVPLSFLGEWGDARHDVQINDTGAPEEPLFFADPGKRFARTLMSWRTRQSTRAGDIVCHRGESSGYSCAEVELVDYAPPGDLCNGPCAPVWVTVDGPSCRGGDSGGPVFAGSTAFGILKGASYAGSGQCDFYYYMSVDYLPQGWTLASANRPANLVVTAGLAQSGPAPEHSR